MKKQIIFTAGGHRSEVAGNAIYHLMPNQHTHHVGHFVFLDYIPPFVRKDKMIPNVGFAHPHRGIATLTYVLNGEAEHYDSRGHRATVYSGGVQWMKAGNGIIHDETMNADTKTTSPLNHGFQFWINLPAKNKKENPDYMAVQANELPLLWLDNNSGWLKVIVGEYDGQKSKIPTYAKQYLYQIRLKAGKQFTLPTEKGLEYAIFLPLQDATINDKVYEAGNLIGFDKEDGIIEVINNLDADADIILFGGEKYTEPFVAYGPFVMSTQEEIHEAYEDFQNGKYGKVVYS
ncbi:MAG TPA: pirin family protein [Parafilimonas sp.]|nr:pirin family protein [Parafilimonas sp.]